jgi:hypothetical protein
MLETATRIRLPTLLARGDFHLWPQIVVAFDNVECCVELVLEFLC